MQPRINRRQIPHRRRDPILVAMNITPSTAKSRHSSLTLTTATEASSKQPSSHNSLNSLNREQAQHDIRQLANIGSLRSTSYKLRLRH